MRDGMTVIPLRLYFRRGKVKIELGLAKGRSHDKRADIKAKTADARRRRRWGGSKERG